MKKILLATFFIALSWSASAQSNFYKISVGAGAGVTQSFTEVKPHDFGLGGYGTLDYLLTPFISLGLELQKGEINGGNFRTEPNHRQFVDSYLATSLNGKVSLGAFLSDGYSSTSDLLKGIYLGSGIGMIKNKPTYSTGPDPADTNYALVAEASSRDIFLPLNLGINIFFADHQGFYRYAVNVNYQANVTLGEGLDGYDDSQLTFRSGNPDIYTFLSVGIKYNFGKMGLSRKTFRR